VITLLLAVVASFIGNMLSLALWFHFDIEGWWEQRRLAHGKTLDQRQREAAEKHGRR
jgi:hypothetical protein